jgi:hypothetical protein
MESVRFRVWLRAKSVCFRIWLRDESVFWICDRLFCVASQVPRPRTEAARVTLSPFPLLSLLRLQGKNKSLWFRPPPTNSPPLLCSVPAYARRQNLAALSSLALWCVCHKHRWFAPCAVPDGLRLLDLHPCHLGAQTPACLPRDYRLGSMVLLCIGCFDDGVVWPLPRLHQMLLWLPPSVATSPQHGLRRWLPFLPWVPHLSESLISYFLMLYGSMDLWTLSKPSPRFMKNLCFLLTRGAPAEGMTVY